MTASSLIDSSATHVGADAPGANSLLRLVGAGKVFLTDSVETHALRNVDIEVLKGEFVALSGPSGCGKSTLLSIIGMIDSLTTGRYFISGVPVHEVAQAERARLRNQEIGFIFQSFNLIGDLTVFENVELPLSYRGGSNKAERRQRVISALQRVEMDHRQDHYPSQLSGGQQQRVAIARALVGDPSLLLADEPTGNLDSKNGEAVMGLLDDLHRSGATIFMVTHDARYAGLSDRTIYMVDGKIVDESEYSQTQTSELSRLIHRTRREAVG